MPSAEHEAIVDAFRASPSLAGRLLATTFGIALPHAHAARVTVADVSDLVPTELRADLVLEIVAGGAQMAVIVEAQLACSLRKRFTWPAYITNLRARLRRPVCLLVVAPDARVARWARRPIVLGPNATVVPLVFGPEAIPVVVREESARRNPGLAMLSVLAHGRSEQAFAVGRAAMLAAWRLPDDRKALYFQVIEDALGASIYAALEDQMAEVVGKGVYFKNAMYRANREAGIKEGLAEGKAQGKAEGKAEAVVAVLEARNLRVSAKTRARILACRDLGVLATWVERVGTIERTAELFED